MRHLVFELVLFLQMPPGKLLWQGFPMRESMLQTLMLALAEASFNRDALEWKRTLISDDQRATYFAITYLPENFAIDYQLSFLPAPTKTKFQPTVTRKPHQPA